MSLLSIPSSRHLFNTAMAKTNRCNPNTMNPPADRRRGRGKGTGKEGAPPAARRSARTNPSAAVDFVDPSLLKPPPKSIPPQDPGDGMPSLVRLGDVPPARAAPPYPLRNNRTPAPNPPAVIYRKAYAPGDVSLLNFRSPSLPPIYDAIPDVFIEGQELDFGQGAAARGGDDLVEDDNVSSNDVAFDDNDDDEVSNYYENGKDDDPNGLDYSSDDDDNNLLFGDDLEEFELVDFADPNRGKKTAVDCRRYKDGLSPPDYLVMSSVEKKIAKDAYDIDMRKWIDQRWKKQVTSKAEVELDWTGVCTSTLRTMKDVEDGTRLAVGQTFPNRDLIAFRTAEEANLCRIYVTILRSSKFMFCSSGVGFYVSATNSESSGWKISKCSTREGDYGVDVGNYSRQVSFPCPVVNSFHSVDHCRGTQGVKHDAMSYSQALCEGGFSYRRDSPSG